MIDKIESFWFSFELAKSKSEWKVLDSIDTNAIKTEQSYITRTKIGWLMEVGKILEKWNSEQITEPWLICKKIR